MTINTSIIQTHIHTHTQVGLKITVKPWCCYGAHDQQRFTISEVTAESDCCELMIRHCSTLCDHPLSTLTDTYTRGAASRHINAPASRTASIHRVGKRKINFSNCSRNRLPCKATSTQLTTWPSIHGTRVDYWHLYYLERLSMTYTVCKNPWFIVGILLQLLILLHARLCYNYNFALYYQRQRTVLFLAPHVCL